MRDYSWKSAERDGCPVYKRDPRVFDLYGYALTFGFCTNAEKAALYAHLLAAWRWGRKAARANRRKIDVLGRAG